MSQTRKRLRDRLSRPGIILVPGVTNAFDAKLAGQAGFEAIFTTGAGIANCLLGVPDLGLLTMSEVVEINRYITDAVDLPVIADCDTGYGNHLNVWRTVQEMERAGVAAIILEDQVSPKRCGHFTGKAVISVEEMAAKLVAATDVRRDLELVIVARTDAIAVEGLESALRRATAYVAAGADVIFVEAPRTVEDMARIPQAVPVPCLINVVEGGLTPMLPATELEQMDFKIALYASLALRAGARGVQRAFEVLKREGTSASILDDTLSWDERQNLVGLPEWQDRDTALAAQAHALLHAHERISDESRSI